MKDHSLELAAAKDAYDKAVEACRFAGAEFDDTYDLLQQLAVAMPFIQQRVTDAYANMLELKLIEIEKL